ncbi:hypothetical protein ANCDUO_13777 [Ancylostoma duodenale]|uniref:Uncharacterized protein n=1 Tax=Ancylostoma duodenale TaxID=51022 RepID=A0A0C2GG03_9BILA|nr:hypothetical protein ANCDUO_13777 [Ancylostoma duodenale]
MSIAHLKHMRWSSLYSIVPAIFAVIGIIATLFVIIQRDSSGEGVRSRAELLVADIHDYVLCDDIRAVVQAEYHSLCHQTYR